MITLNHGRHLNRELQAEWHVHGEAAFEFVELEVFEEKMSTLVLKETLKERKTVWVEVVER